MLSIETVIKVLNSSSSGTGAWPYINDWLEYVLPKECTPGFVNIVIIILTFSNFFETVYMSLQPVGRTVRLLFHYDHS